MSFQIRTVRIPDLLLIEPPVFRDERGYFMEKWRKSTFERAGLPAFAQDNFSVSKQGVIRGLHFQNEPYAQGKLVSVAFGRVWDVAVDLRKGSSTFGQWFGVELSSENNLMFYIPPGFAHGFSVLSPEAGFMYKCTAEHSPQSEGGIIFDDPDLGIDWKVNNHVVSDRDKKWPKLKSLS